MTVAFSFHFCTISGSHLHLQSTIFFISWTDLTSHCGFFLPWHLVSTCSLCTWLHERVLWPFKDIANVFYFYFFNLSQRKWAELNYKNKCFSLLDICFCRGQLTCLRPIKKTVVFTFGAEVHALHIERSIPQSYFLQYYAKTVHITLLSPLRRMVVVYEQLRSRPELL